MENKVKELVETIIANPNLPVIHFASEVKTGDYDFARVEVQSVKVAECVFVDDGDGCNMLYTRDEQDVLELHLAEMISEDNAEDLISEDSPELSKDQIKEEAHKRAEALDWAKAIIVTLGKEPLI